MSVGAVSEPAGRILLVEDEESLAESIRYSLEREGYAVSVAGDGRVAIERFRADTPDLVILDLMLPEMSGLDVCRMIRETSTVPIVMVTAKDSEADKVTGLELGADDYVTKPFSVRELVSRIRAHLRRVRMQAPPRGEEILSGGPIEMDVSRHEVKISGQSVADLTKVTTGAIVKSRSQESPDHLFLQYPKISTTYDNESAALWNHSDATAANVIPNLAKVMDQTVLDIYNQFKDSMPKD